MDDYASMARGRFRGFNMGHVNPLFFRKIKYFIYLFFKIGIILTIDIHVSRRLNGALDSKLSYLPRNMD